jgi:hypothetical protein
LGERPEQDPALLLETAGNPRDRRMTPSRSRVPRSVMTNSVCAPGETLVAGSSQARSLLFPRLAFRGDSGRDRGNVETGVLTCGVPKTPGLGRHRRTCPDQYVDRTRHSRFGDSLAASRRGAHHQPHRTDPRRRHGVRGRQQVHCVELGRRAAQEREAEELHPRLHRSAHRDLPVRRLRRGDGSFRRLLLGQLPTTDRGTRCPPTTTYSSAAATTPTATAVRMSRARCTRSGSPPIPPGGGAPAAEAPASPGSHRTVHGKRLVSAHEAPTSAALSAPDVVTHVPDDNLLAGAHGRIRQCVCVSTLAAVAEEMTGDTVPAQQPAGGTSPAADAWPRGGCRGCS